MSDRIITPDGLTLNTTPNQELMEISKQITSISDWVTNSAIAEDIRILRDVTVTESEDFHQFQEWSQKDKVEQKKYFTELTQTIKTTGANAAQGILEFGVNTFLLGPLQLITNPLLKALDVNIPTIFKQAIGGLKEKFQGSLSREVVLQRDPGSVYVADTMTRLLGKKEEKTGLLDNIAKTLRVDPASLASGLVKGGAMAAIIGGLVWAAIDGIRGFFTSKQWGTSQLAGVVGGVLGGMDSGFMGAFKNMGKWALIGAGVGTLIVPGLGTLVGGLIGAALGGILGFIGGKNIAKAVDKVGEFFHTTIDRATEIYKNIEKKIPVITPALKSFFRQNPVINMIETSKNIVAELFNKQDDLKEKALKIGAETFHGMTFGLFRSDGLLGSLFKSITDKFKIRTDSIVNFGLDTKKFFTGIIDNITGSVVGFFTNFIATPSKSMADFIKDIMDNLIKKIGYFFTMITDYLEFAGSTIKKEGLGGGLLTLAGDVTVGGGKKFAQFQEMKEQERGFDTKNMNALTSNLNKNSEKQTSIIEKNLEEQKKTNEILSKKEMNNNIIIQNNTKENYSIYRQKTK